jgi:NADPH-dependent F420 reductase
VTHIAIVGGTGPAGRGLALRLARAGVAVRLGSRDAGRAAQVVRDLCGQAGDLPLIGCDNQTAASDADVVIVATPVDHAPDVVGSVRDTLRPGALVIDIGVPIVFESGRPRFVELREGSAAERLGAHVPAGVLYAATFKTLPAVVLSRIDTPLDCDEFVCAGSRDALDAAMDVVRRLPGVRPIAVGGLEMARVIERMTLLAIAVNVQYRMLTTRFRVAGSDRLDRPPLGPKHSPDSP